ncbi:MAG TPA: hypothetical protein VK475_13070, partial [Pyrinomonadaceae bacterium]|nr:hypothetical protein [Pyrinomonadaceae bacterium]
MSRHWSIDEILIKLPLISVKLKAPVTAGKGPRKDAQSMIPVEGLQGIKVGFKAFNGSFVGADINRNGELTANGPKMDTWETFELFRLPG